MIIVIDGPSGAGKSTLAKRLAGELGFSFFDTGAMYRSVCWYLLDKNIPLEDQEQIEEVLKDFHFQLRRQGDITQFLVNDQDVSQKIRTTEIDKKVSIISAYPFVRKALVHLQEEFSQSVSAVFEGRDMGTVVFPKAEVKFFLVADSKVRAERRYMQLKELYPNTAINLDEIQSDILKRDEYDSNRECSPLKRAEDAHLIDASHLPIEAILKVMKGYVAEQKA